MEASPRVEASPRGKPAGRTRAQGAVDPLEALELRIKDISGRVAEYEEPVHHDIPVFIPEQPVDHVPKAPLPAAPVPFVEVHAPSPYA